MIRKIDRDIAAMCKEITDACAVLQDSTLLRLRSSNMLVQPDVEFAWQEQMGNIRIYIYEIHAKHLSRRLMLNNDATITKQEYYKAQFAPLFMRARQIKDELRRPDLKRDYRAQITGWFSKNTHDIERLRQMMDTDEIFRN